MPELDLETVKAKCEIIHVSGLTRTKDDILSKITKDIFKAQTFNDLVQESVKAQQLMKSLGLFQNVGIKVDVGKGSPHGYEVTFKVQEFGRINGYLGTEVGSNDVLAKINGGMPNTFGRAEKLSCRLTLGKKATDIGVMLEKPINANPTQSLLAGLHKGTTEYTWSGYNEIERGAALEYKFLSRAGNHALRWNGVWREVKSSTKFTDMEIREHAGHSLKSSIKHELSRDERDHLMFPTTGYLAHSAVELAGFGGDAKFLKNDLQLQFNKSFLQHYVFQLSLAGGCMRSLEESAKLHLTDRFYVGGPLTMRGFKMNGCGPRRGECSLGGNAYCLGAAHIYSPLPFRAGKAGFSNLFRLQAWASAGNVFNMDRTNIQWRQLAQNIADTMRLSYGAGLVFNFASVARIEINYCFPFKYQAGDATAPGWTWGFGVTFM